MLWKCQRGLCLQCRVREVAILFSLPEVHEGHGQIVPASPWDLREVRALGSLSEARLPARQAEQQCPLGFLHNLPVLSKSLFPGWPQYSTADNYLQYHGPLPKSCGCPVCHRPFSGGSRDQSLNHVHSPSLRRQFWSLFFSGSYLCYSRGRSDSCFALDTVYLTSALVVDLAVVSLLSLWFLVQWFTFAVDATRAYRPSEC